MSDLFALTDDLNKRFGRKDSEERRPSMPLTAQETADYSAYQAEQSRKRADADAALALLQRPLKYEPAAPYPGLRSKACQKARRKVEAARPGHCERCGSQESLEAHHVIPYAQLKKAGLENVEEAHVFEWICEKCHVQQHSTEAVHKLMLRRASKSK